MMEALELDSRRRIYEYLQANPGVHLRLIGKVLGMSTGMLSYHLGYMERNGILKSEAEGHRKRYFLAAFAEAQRRIIGTLRQDVPRKIMVEILRHRGRTFAELQTSVGVSKSTLSYHLKRMMQRDVVLRVRRERESLFHLKDPDGVVRILLDHRPTLWDESVGFAISQWSRLRT